MSQEGMDVAISKVLWLYQQAAAWCLAEKWIFTPESRGSDWYIKLAGR